MYRRFELHAGRVGCASGTHGGEGRGSIQQPGNTEGATRARREDRRPWRCQRLGAVTSRCPLQRERIASYLLGCCSEGACSPALASAVGGGRGCGCAAPQEGRPSGSLARSSGGLAARWFMPVKEPRWPQERRGLPCPLHRIRWWRTRSAARGLRAAPGLWLRLCLLLPCPFVSARLDRNAKTLIAPLSPASLRSWSPSPSPSTWRTARRSSGQPTRESCLLGCIWRGR